MMRFYQQDGEATCSAAECMLDIIAFQQEMLDVLSINMLICVCRSRKQRWKEWCARPASVAGADWTSAQWSGMAELS